jgi:hypothetical protein
MTTLALTSADSILEDRLAQLDPAVREKYRSLEQDRHDASDAVDGTQRRWEEAREPAYRARIAATAAADKDKHDMGRIARGRHTGKPEPPSPAAETSAARLTQAEELERARREARDDAVQRFTVAQRILAGVQEVIRTTDAAALQPIRPPRGTPTKGTDVGAEIDRLRVDIGKVVAERTALAVAPVPLAEAAQRLDDHLDGLAAQWEPPVGDYVRPVYAPSGADSFSPYKPIVLLANLAPMRDALHARLRSVYERQPASVPSADRPARAADLATRQRQLELAEEQLILEAEQAGHLIARRPDADPRVVLTAVLAE